MLTMLNRNKSVGCIDHATHINRSLRDHEPTMRVWRLINYMNGPGSQTGAVKYGGNILKGIYETILDQ